MTNVSKRTIDYYTSLGLLNAERSKSNYRIYSQTAIADLQFIEECKQLHLPLDEIKRKLEMKKLEEVIDIEVEKHIEAVTQQMKHLQSDLDLLIPLIDHLDEGKAKVFSNLISTEGQFLLKSLSCFTR